MRLNFLKSLTTIGLGLLVSPLLTSVAKAETTDLSNSNASQPLMISQAEGHDLYMGAEQIGCGATIGHVVARSGTIGFIVFPDGGHLHTDIGGVSGDDVLVEMDDNGNYYVTDMAHPVWISHLESEYGWRRIDYYCSSYVPLTERTSSLWAELDSRPATRTSIPARPQTRPYTPPPAQPAPVRGLW